MINALKRECLRTEMKFLGTFTLLVWSMAALGAEDFLCTKNNIELSLKVRDFEIKKVFWSLRLIGEQEATFSGSGDWQKEVESEDAFSSYDDMTAISFKNNRAVFVLPNNKVIVFAECEKL